MSRPTNPRILVTGIPSHLTRLIQRADKAQVHYSEKQRDSESRDNFIQELKNISNTGNYLIGEGAMTALLPTAKHIPFWHLYNCVNNGTGLEEVNKEFDICVFTCANLLRKGLSADAEALVLSKLDMPVVMLGIGIQNRPDIEGEDGLPAGTKKLLEVLKGREHYFLTRGENAAGYLRDQGFSYVRPVGCPSLYFRPDNMRKAISRLPQVKVGEGRTVFTGYMGAELETIGDMNALGSDDGRSAYVVQDELLHFDMQLEPDANGRAYDSTTGELVGPLTYKGSGDLKKKISVHAFLDTNQWRAWCSTMDFSFGRRFHGNVISMQAGVPSLMVAVDDRMREMLNFSGLPKIDARDLNAANDRRAFVSDHIAAMNIPDVVEKYSARERNFRSVLSEIGIG
ncbi:MULTISPECIES: polysaccharide pyruvyl transferase family protein [Brucella/Ochrobactrum group]|uniref:polysaccharide pyruvyl transferase family protein n=1 Tax=Brucella/Ochrobactrum group TaxID=2826938 RepID=UPI000D707C99|nr:MULTISPECIES: polysaccharide pyruvyl transferase family protein [Brucella/Ochrobactrum group]MCH4542086.1 polysaccharide pyruvyl transferase family protein [Ochrobactrum sp. A-1]PWU73960.1 polysaccharide pyruvyl transferase family protein [Ochrobactrum sp. POC9]